MESSDVDIENVTLSTNVTYAGDSSYHIVDDSVIISHDVDSDEESSIPGSDSSEDEHYSCANSLGTKFRPLVTEFFLIIVYMYFHITCIYTCT